MLTDGANLFTPGPVARAQDDAPGRRSPEGERGDRQAIYGGTAFPVMGQKGSGTTSPPAGVRSAWTTTRGVAKGSSRTEPSASTNGAPAGWADPQL